MIDHDKFLYTIQKTKKESEASLNARCIRLTF